MRLLIVEDEKVLAELLKHEFEAAGVLVCLAFDGVEALKQANKMNPDMILLDLVLPKKSGYEVLLGLRSSAQLKCIPVIILSNLGHDDDIKGAMRLGVLDYFVKAQHPIKEIVEKVKRHLEKPSSKKPGAACDAEDVVLHKENTQEEKHAMAEFISVASHRLRTPLGILRWNTEILLKEDASKLTPAVAQRLKQNYLVTLQTIQVVNDLLNVSRIEQGRICDEPNWAGIKEVTQAVVDKLKSETERREITIVLDIAQGTYPQIFIDHARLSEAIENVLLNAIKYSHSGGKVTVKVFPEPLAYRIEVEDAGIGIPVVNQPKIFTKFYRAPNAVLKEPEGSGLGLYLVKAYLNEWGGSVTFTSEENKGSRFILKIPYDPKASTIAQSIPPSYEK